MMNLSKKLGFSNTALDYKNGVERNRNLLKFMLLSSAIVVCSVEPSLVLATPALDSAGVAATSAGTNGISKALRAIIGTITGPMGQSIAVLAVVVMGIMAMFGKLAWDHAVKVVLGIAIVFGASSILSWVTTGTAQ